MGDPKKKKEIEELIQEQNVISFHVTIKEKIKYF
jgi:hypothetical protein